MLGIGSFSSQVGIAKQYDNQSAIFASNDRRLARLDSGTINFGADRADELTAVNLGTKNLAYQALEKLNKDKVVEAGKTFNTFNAMA